MKDTRATYALSSTCGNLDHGTGKVVGKAVLLETLARHFGVDRGRKGRDEEL